MAEPLADEGGEETGEPAKTPGAELQKMPQKMPEDSSLKRDSNPHWRQARKAEVLTVTARVAPSFDVLILSHRGSKL